MTCLIIPIRFFAKLISSYTIKFIMWHVNLIWNSNPLEGKFKWFNIKSTLILYSLKILANVWYIVRLDLEYSNFLNVITFFFLT